MLLGSNRVAVEARDGRQPAAVELDHEGLHLFPVGSEPLWVGGVELAVQRGTRRRECVAQEATVAGSEAWPDATG